MSFAIRQINLQFTTVNGKTLDLQGLRCSAIITNPGGNSAYGTLQLKVYGMTLAQMNEYSSTGANMVGVQNTTVVVSAGNQGDAALQQVFSGTIISSFIDFASVPDVAFNCSAVTGYFAKGNTIASNSFQGSHNAEDIIQALALTNGFKFVNGTGSNKAHAVLQNQNVYGSAVDQMQTVANNAAFPLKIENNTVYIWANNGNVDNVVVDVSPETGMVGYPSYWMSGFTVKSEFKPLIANGRTVNLTSSIPKANGQFPVHTCTHEISTLTPDGPWFTTSQLNLSIHVAPN